MTSMRNVSWTTHHRPVVVIPSDVYNSSRLQTVVVMALTTNRRLAAPPGNTLILAELSGLTDDSVANATQITTIDRRHLEQRVGKIADWAMDEIDEGIRRVLGVWRRVRQRSPCHPTGTSATDET